MNILEVISTHKTEFAAIGAARKLGLKEKDFRYTWDIDERLVDTE